MLRAILLVLALGGSPASAATMLVALNGIGGTVTPSYSYFALPHITPPPPGSLPIGDSLSTSFYVIDSKGLPISVGYSGLQVVYDSGGNPNVSTYSAPISIFHPPGNPNAGTYVTTPITIPSGMQSLFMTTHADSEGFSAGIQFSYTITYNAPAPLVAPIPAALPLFASGLGLLGLFFWGRSSRGGEDAGQERSGISRHFQILPEYNR